MNGISRQLLDDITTKDSTNSTENNENDGKNCNKTKEKMANGSSSPDTALDLFDNSMETFLKILNKIHITPVTELTRRKNTNNDYRFLDKSEEDESEQDDPKLLFQLGLGNPKPDKTDQVKLKQDKPEQHGSEKNEPEQDRPKQAKPEQDKSEKDKTEQIKQKQSKLEKDKSEQNNTEQDKTKQNKPEQGKLEQDKAEQSKPKQDKPEQSTASTTSVYSTPICALKLPTVAGEIDTTLNTSEDKTLQDLKNTGKFKSNFGDTQSNAPFTLALASGGVKFDKDLLMSLYTWNLGTATIQTSETTTNKSIRSFPFRDKKAASIVLALKYQSLNSIQKTLPKDSNAFKTTIPSFSAAEKELPSLYVFGSQKTVVTTSKFAFENSDQDEFGNFLTTLLVYKSPEQGKLNRPSNEVQKINIDLYKYEDHKGALAMANDAIKLCPDNITFYGVRCHYYMKAGMYKEAFQDAQIAVAYDPYFTDGYICIAKYYVIIGSTGCASDILRKVRASCDISAAQCRALDQLKLLLDLRLDMQRAFSQHDFLEAVVCADLFLEMCPSNFINATKAQYLVMLGHEVLALATAEQCLRDDNAEPEALYAKGLCLYYRDELQQAVEYFQQVRVICPSHVGANDWMQKAGRLIRLINEGKESFAAGRLQESLRDFKEALKVDDIPSKVKIRLHCENAQIYLKLNNKLEAIAEYMSALEFDNKCVEALRARAECYADVEDYGKAIDDYEKTYTIVEDEATKRDARDAIAALTKRHEYQQKTTLAWSLILYPTTQNVDSALKIAEECLQYNREDTKALCLKASCLYHKDQFVEALDIYQQALILRPDDLMALRENDETSKLIDALKKGEEMFAAGKWNDALQSYDDAITFAKTTVTHKLYCKKAEIYLKLNRISYALTEYTNALSVDSKCVEALRGRAQCYTNVDRYEDAANDYEKLYSIDRSEATEELLNDCKVKMHCKKAAICLKSNEINQAIAEYSKALSVDSECVEALRGRAKCYTDVDRYEDAANDYEKLYSIDRSEATEELLNDCKVKMHCKKAVICLKSNEINQAIAEYSKALSVDSEYVEALRGRAKCYTDVDRYEDAANDYEKLYSIDRSEATEVLLRECEAKNYCQKAAKYLKSNEINQAIAEYSKALSVDSECVEALRGRANCYTDVDRYEDALIDYERLHSIDRNETTAELLNECKAKMYCKKAATCLKSHETNRAIIEYTNALSVDSKCVEALRGRAKCYTDVDRYEDAANDYEKLYSIDRSEATKQLLYKCKTSRVAQQKAEMGNAWYESQNYNSALAMYEEAIRLCPDRAEYRALAFRCYMELAMLREAEVEAKKAVDLYMKSSKSFSGIAKCYIALGDLRGAERAIHKARGAGDDSTSERRMLQSQQRLHAQAQQYIEQRDCERAVSCTEECMKESPFSVQLKLMKAQCLAMLGQIDEAVEIANECIRSDRSDAEAHFVKGLCFYYNEQYDQAMDYFKHALLLYPDHKGAAAAYKRTKLLREKINQGTAALEQGRWRGALRLYGAALRVDAAHVRVNAQLHLHMATAHSELGETQRAVDECVAALALHEKHARGLTHEQRVQALSLRAECLTALGRHQDAVDDYERLYAADPRPHVQALWDEAKQARDASPNEDHYQILGVLRTATKTDIEKAYKRLRAVHHPDRHAASCSFLRKHHERRFQALQQAYKQLSDDARSDSD